MIDCGMNISIENYLQRFNTSYMTFTYNLACGIEFSKLINENPNYFEGSLIRSIKKLDEILRETLRAASELGIVELGKNFRFN